jgi:hypothetical protein
LCAPRHKNGIQFKYPEKSTRGRNKQITTLGFACPNPDCDYFGVTDQRLHAALEMENAVSTNTFSTGNAIWWRHIVASKRFSSRLHTPLYYLKTVENRIELVLMLLAEGCDISVLVRRSKHCEATITR